MIENGLRSWMAAHQPHRWPTPSLSGLVTSADAKTHGSGYSSTHGSSRASRRGARRIDGSVTEGAPPLNAAQSHAPNRL